MAGMTPAVDQRPEPPLWADEWDQLTGFLEFLRATIEWKTSGIADDDLRLAHEPSRMTLGGLLAHLTFVEDYWFGTIWNGRPAADRWVKVDWRASPDWEWETARSMTGAQLRAGWTVAVSRSRAEARRCDLDDLAERPAAGGPVSKRWILIHMIEEYARHCGHADLLREAIDGSVGE